MTKRQRPAWYARVAPYNSLGSVIISRVKYNAMRERLENLDDIGAAKQSLADDPHGLPFEAAMREIERMAVENESNNL